MTDYKKKVVELFFSEDNGDKLFSSKIKPYQKDSFRFSHALKVLNFPSGKVIVEIGPFPGTGFYYFGESNSIIGFGRANTSFIEKANLLGHEVFDLDFERANIPIKYQSVSDITLVMEVLEHIRNPLQFLTQVLFTLKPGGVLYLTTNNFSYLGYVLKLLLNKSILDDISTEGEFYPGHCRYYSLSELVTFFNKTGHNILYQHHVNFLPNSMAYKNIFFGVFKNLVVTISPRSYSTHIEVLIQKPF